MFAAEGPVIQADVQVAQGADGPKVTMRCSDQTAVVPLGQLLSALRSLTNVVVEAAVEREAGAGRRISCKAGCGTCCRQLVPISVTEARQLPQLIESLGEAHRGRVQARFNEAVLKLRASSLWDRLERFGTLPRDEVSALKVEYFRLGIPCPFLEEEACSIHPIRPLICRQYLVTSPAENCRNPWTESIARVPLAADVLGALKRVEAREPTPPQAVPLVLAPFLNLGESESKKTVSDWMRDLQAEIREFRDEQLAAGKPNSALDGD
jgi:Fe-S-cluster containining protein